MYFQISANGYFTVAVLAFKAAYTLEAARRDNDKKIQLLYLEMKDMMSVLLRFVEIRLENKVAHFSNRVKDLKKIKKEHENRLQKLTNAIADDIKACANACDTYSKKKFIVKLFRGIVWENRLAFFAGVFTKRRGELEFEFALYTSEVGIDSNTRTKHLEIMQEDIQAKYVQSPSKFYQEETSKLDS